MKSVLIRFVTSIVLVLVSSVASGAVDIFTDNKPVTISSSRNIFKEMSLPYKTYVIKRTINLNGKLIVIPNSSTLVFKNGVIKNGMIVFQNTMLAGNVKIRCHVKGNILNDTLKTDWFVDGSSAGKQIHDSSNLIQNVFNLGSRTIVFGEGYYQFHDINIGKNIELIGNRTFIKPVKHNLSKYNFNFLKNVFYTKEADTIIVKNIHFEGEITGTLLPSFKSDSIFGEPLFWVDKAKKVIVDRCLFKNIENCTYCNKAYNYYGKKQGSCVCLWDVSDASFINCEQVGNRHDEQVWIIAVNKPIMDTKVIFSGNYIHDMTPGPNSSVFTCVAGNCLMENNKVDRYSYPGSMFNVFAKKAIIRNNVITNSYCSSVFDVCEYSYFHNDEIVVENNHVDAVNSALVLAQSTKATIRNNTFRGIGLYYSANNRVHQKGVNIYKYWYSDTGDVLPTDSETVIEGNICDFTAYDGNRSIAGTKANYGTGEILEPQKYSNVGVNYGCGILIHPNEAKAGSVTITNNRFTSIQSLKGILDKNNLAGISPHAIRLVNTENVTIRGNTFNGCYRIVQSPDEYTCISIYNYPDVMEKLENPGAISRNPSHYGKYVIEDNVFNVPKGKTFYPFSVYARTNATRKTPLVIKELVVKNNKTNDASLQIFSVDHHSRGKSVIKQFGEVKILKSTYG